LDGLVASARAVDAAGGGALLRRGLGPEGSGGGVGAALRTSLPHLGHRFPFSAAIGTWMRQQRQTTEFIGPVHPLRRELDPERIDAQANVGNAAVIPISFAIASKKTQVQCSSLVVAMAATCNRKAILKARRPE
jgi:hypothetical protein